MIIKNIMKIKNIILLLLFTCCISLNAQNKGGGNFDIEKFKKSRSDFFIKELELTPAQAKLFIPLLDQLMEKKYLLNREVRRNHRALNQQASKSDADYYKSIDIALDARIKEAQIQKEYMQKMKAVIPADKLYKYHHVEMKFMEQALKQVRDQKGKKRD